MNDLLLLWALGGLLCRRVRLKQDIDRRGGLSFGTIHYICDNWVGKRGDEYNERGELVFENEKGFVFVESKPYFEEIRGKTVRIAGWVKLSPDKFFFTEDYPPHEDEDSYY